MKRSRVPLSIVAVVVALGMCLSWQTVTSAAPDPTVGAGALLFEDDFNGAAGSAPDPSRWEDWSACTYNSSAAFGNITCGNNEKLDGAGHLVVPATPQAGSAIRTGRSFSFQYGTLSAWIRMPSQAGYWPAFWSLNSRYDGKQELPVGEVDAVESYTTWLDAYHAAGHSYGADGSRYDSADNLCPRSNVDISAGFHEYSARIEPGKITYFFDGTQCGSVYTKAAGKAWGFGPDVTRGNWLILDLAVGGAGGQQKKPTANAQMLVDRVEVRALPTGAAAAAATTTRAAPATTAKPAPTTTPPATATTRPPTVLAAPATTAPQTPPPTTSTSPSASGAAVESGAVYRLSNTCGGMVLGVPNASTAAGTPLRTAAWTGQDDQRWRIVSTSAGYYKLLNVASGQAANVAYASQADGATVIQYPDVSGANAEWAITVRSDGTRQLTAHHSGKALDVHGASPAAGAAVEQSAPAPGCAESWTLTRS